MGIENSDRLIAAQHVQLNAVKYEPCSHGFLLEHELMKPVVVLANYRLKCTKEDPDFCDVQKTIYLVFCCVLKLNKCRKRGFVKNLW